MGQMKGAFDKCAGGKFQHKHSMRYHKVINYTVGKLDYKLSYLCVFLQIDF